MRFYLHQSIMNKYTEKKTIYDKIRFYATQRMKTFESSRDQDNTHNGIFEGIQEVPIFTTRV